MSVSFAPISAASAIVLAELAPAEVGSKKRPRQEEEFKPIFDIEFLCAEIGKELQEDLFPGQAQWIAETIGENHPEILMQLSNYLPSTVKEEFQKYFNENEDFEEKAEGILDVMKCLSVWSLLNSKYLMTISSLEGDILSYMQLAKQEHSEELVKSVAALVQQDLPENLEQSLAYSASLNSQTGKIDEVLNLFYYADPGSKERIELLASEVTLANGSSRYPNCKTYFRAFCQSLKILDHERATLRSLQSQIRQKMEEIKPHLKSLYEELPSRPLSPCPERDVFCIRESTFLWQSGSRILQRVFLATLQGKRSRARCFFFQNFVSAINAASALDPRWLNCQYSSLFPRNLPVPPLPDFELGFIGNVWAIYTDSISDLQDLGDFMREFISAIPEESFQTVIASADKETALRNSFFEFFGEGATFETLKQWCEKRLSLTR